MDLQPVGPPAVRGAAPASRPRGVDCGSPTARVLPAGNGRRLGGPPAFEDPGVLVPRPERSVQSTQRAGEFRQGLRHGPLLAADDPLLPVLDRDTPAGDLNRAVMINSHFDTPRCPRSAPPAGRPQNRCVVQATSNN